MRTVFLAAALTLTGCDSQPPKTHDEIAQFVRVADEAMGVAEKTGSGATEAEVQEALGNMTAALDAARTQVAGITRRIAVANYHGTGSIQPRDVAACIDTSVATAASFAQMPMDALASALIEIVDCASKTSAYFQGASGEDAAAVGLAVSFIYPIRLAGEAKGGLSTAPALQAYVAANEAIVAKLAPHCPERKEQPVRYECSPHAVALAVRPRLASLNK
jgi:hypothetical protein